MALIAMKFGGTSVADIQRIRHVAGLVKAEVDRGNKVAVVVSAMSGETNKLVAWTNDAAKSGAGENHRAVVDQREYDVVVAAGEQETCGLLAITLNAMGVKARSWLGWPAFRAGLRACAAPPWAGAAQTPAQWRWRPAAERRAVTSIPTWMGST